MPKKTITITLHISEITYDVQNKTYITGRSRSDGSNYEDVAHLQMSDDDEEKNQLMRSIGNAVSSLRSGLGEYIEVAGLSGDNILASEDENIIVKLNLPDNYNEAMTDTISSAMHQYIVNTALADWLTMTDKQDAADYLTFAAANIERIKDALYKRSRPVRPVKENP